MRPNLSNSIYQQKNSGMGLNVKDGMLINNRPDGQTGIQQLAQIRKSMKRAEKVSMYSEAIMIGNMGDCCK
jgi:hypothetical protein